MSLPPLILIPGLLNDAELWRDQVAALSDVADCRVADITRDDSLEAMARNVLAEAPERFALAGFSLGGYVAVEIARIAPERVDRLALLDTSISADTPERATARSALNKAARAPGKFHGFGDRLLKTYLADSHLEDEAIISRIRGMTERLGPDVFVRQNSVVRKDGAGVLRALRCPILVLAGESDAITPFRDHEAMAVIARGRLVSIPDAGHMTPIENPAAVSAALREWLDPGEQRQAALAGSGRASVGSEAPSAPLCRAPANGHAAVRGPISDMSAYPPLPECAAPPLTRNRIGF